MSKSRVWVGCLLLTLQTLCRLLAGPNPKHFCRSWKAWSKAAGSAAPWILCELQPMHRGSLSELNPSSLQQEYKIWSNQLRFRKLWCWNSTTLILSSWLQLVVWLPLAAHVQEMSVQSYANCSGQFGIRFERSEALRFEKHEPFIAYSHWTYS